MAAVMAKLMELCFAFFWGGGGGGGGGGGKNGDQEYQYLKEMWMFVKFLCLKVFKISYQSGHVTCTANSDT